MTAFIALVVKKMPLLAENASDYIRANVPPVVNVHLHVLTTKKKFASFYQNHPMFAMDVKLNVVVP